MHTPQSHLVREALLRDPAAGRYVYIGPRQLPLECVSLAEASAHMDKHLPRNTDAGRPA
jgi:hypothetical protein